MTITTRSRWGTESTYTIVNEIPAGFFVWNIGENMGTSEYIPLCEAVAPKSDSINPDTLKAVKLPAGEVAILRKAAHCGVTSKSRAIATLNRQAKSTFQKKKKALAAAALPILEAITA